MPVDYDPFASAAPVAPKLVPVDYDPFADNPGAAPRLVPVDYDPFADVAAAAPITGASSSPPNVQPSLADGSFHSFPSVLSPDSFFAQNLPGSSFAPRTQDYPGAAAYLPSNNLTPLVRAMRPPILSDAARRFSQLDNPPPRTPAFDPSMSLLGLIPQTWPENMSLLAPVPKLWIPQSYAGSGNAPSNAMNPLGSESKVSQAGRQWWPSTASTGADQRTKATGGSSESGTNGAISPTLAQWYAPFIDALRPSIEGGAGTLGARAARPPLPPGIKQGGRIGEGGMGELMRWGKELDAQQWAENIARDPGFAKQIIESLQQNGFTKEMIDKWSSWYQEKFEESQAPQFGRAQPPGGVKQFRFRAEGLRRLFEQWPDDQSTAPPLSPQQTWCSNPMQCA